MGQSKITVFRAVFGGDEAAGAGSEPAVRGRVDAAVAGGEIEPLPGARPRCDALRAPRRPDVPHHRVLRRHPASSCIDALGWRDLVDLALSPGDGIRGRPYPDLVLAASCGSRSTACQEVAVAGDTVSDLVAGTAAGAAIVAGVLTGAHGRAQLESAPHTHVLDSIADLPAVVFDR